MESCRIVLYVIVPICVRGCAHGRVEDARSVHANWLNHPKHNFASHFWPPKFCRTQRSWSPRDTTFRSGHFGRLWSSNGVRMTKLWPFYGYNSTGFQHRENTVSPASKVSWSRGPAIFHHSELPIILRVYEYNTEELLCTFSSKNEACSCPNIRVESGWVIEHVKPHFLGFWCVKEPPPSLQSDM